MLRNYLTLVIRKFKSERFFTLLNVLGLSIGVTAFILIGTFVQYHLSFDDFHRDRDRIQIMSQSYENPLNKEEMLTVNSKVIIGDLIKESIPGVEVFQTIGNREVLINLNGDSFYQEGGIYADPSLFTFFDFKMLYGDPEQGLVAQNQVVITLRTAEKLFKKWDAAIGAEVKMDGQLYIISGIAENPPVNSHFNFNIIFPMMEYDRSDPEFWKAYCLNYLKFDTHLDIAVTQKAILELIKVKQPNRLDEIKFGFIPLNEIHLSGELIPGWKAAIDKRYIYLFSTIALFLLVIASFNYVNLATALSVKRAKEVGLRKTLGASRGQIISYYLTESLLITFVAVVLAFAIAERTLPIFNDFLQINIELHYFSSQFFMLTIGLTLLLGIMSGLYPAFYLSGFSPLNAFRGGKDVRSKSRFKKVAVISQFFITQALIIATIIVQSQLNYIQTKDLGYDREQLLYFNTHHEIRGNGEAMKAELLTIPGIKSVSMSFGILDGSTIVVIPARVIQDSEKLGDGSSLLLFQSLGADQDFIETMGMKIINGQNFDQSNISANMGNALITESTVKKLGWDQPIGKTIRNTTVLGVVRDFHYKSLKDELFPTVIQFRSDASTYANIKISSSDTREVLKQIETVWNQFIPDRPFEYEFYNDRYDKYYKSESRLATLFYIFAGLSITISLLGLIGLSTFSVQQRMKEISIRKVLGATFQSILIMLSKGYFGLILIGFVLAAPILYYFMSLWLDNFKYRIELGPNIFVLAIVLTLAFTMSTVVFRSWGIARQNPVNTLRND